MFAYLNFFISNELIINAWFWAGFKLEFYVMLVKALHGVKKQVVFLREIQFILLSTAVIKFIWLGMQLINWIIQESWN